MKKHLRPQFSDDDDVEQYMDANNKSEDDEFETISFGALKTAQQKLEDEDASSIKVKRTKPAKPETKTRENKPERKIIDKKRHIKVRQTRHTSDSDGGEHDMDGFSDMSDGMFDEEDEQPSRGKFDQKKRGKHAPTETSSKKRVSRIRQIPGLENPRDNSLYRDIRFDAAFGKADLDKVRKNYKFLDDYRHDEVQQIDKMLKDPKMRGKLGQRDVDDLEYQSKSLRSRLESLKNRDMAQDVIKKYKQEKGIKGNFFLKESDKRKIVQKHKFDNMKSGQREKVVERKRKRRLGKEFKQLEFNKPRD